MHTKDETPALDRWGVVDAFRTIGQVSQIRHEVPHCDAEEIVLAMQIIEEKLAVIRAKLWEGGVIP